jgi:release factor glutamine methyltransferase
MLQEAVQNLRGAGVPTARLDAEILLARAAGRKREDLIAHPEVRLSPEVRYRYQVFVERRERGEPVSYILGCKEFWSLELKVDPAVLIPRPETEILVSETLRRLPTETPGDRKDQMRLVLDLGTGSGNVALALAKERADLWVVATDISQAALHVAQENVGSVGLPNRVALVSANWLEAFGTGRFFEAVVSNPPYIRERDWDTLDVQTLSYEPRTALTAGEDGLDAYRVIVRNAPGVLWPGGWLMLEIGMDQAEEVRGLMEDSNAYEDVEVIQDLAGRDRVVAARRRR